MNWNELLPLLPVIASIVGGAATIVGAILWLMRRHARKLSKVEARISRLQKERDDALLQKKAAEKERDKAKEAATKYFNAGKQEHEKRLNAEQRVRTAEKKIGELDAALTTTNGGVDALRSKLVAAEQDAEKAHQKAASHSKKVKQLQTQINGVVKQDGRVWRKSLPPDTPVFIPLSKRKTLIISVLNLKGGVGKTTITANLAGYLGQSVGKRALMIDVDHQRSLSQLVLSSNDREAVAAAGRTVQHFLTSQTRDGHALIAATEPVPNVENCCVMTNVDPAPGCGIDQSLDDLEMHLMSEWLVNSTSTDVRFLMRQALHSDVVRTRFDFVLFDCPPRLTTACINALTASDFLLIPVQAEAVSIRSVQHLLVRLKELCDAGVLAELRILGLVANMVSPKTAEKSSHETKLLEHAASAAQHTWGQPVRAFKTKLIRDHKYAEATQELDSRRPLKLAIDYPSIHKQYQELMSEIEERINENRVVARVSS